jgi:hypothetical protein
MGFVSRFMAFCATGSGRPKVVPISVILVCRDAPAAPLATVTLVARDLASAPSVSADGADLRFRCIGGALGSLGFRCLLTFSTPSSG